MTQRKKKPASLTLPIWLFVLLLLNAGASGALVEYYLVSQKLKTTTEQPAENQVSQDVVKTVAQKVIPPSGYKTSLSWGDIGKKLVEVGAIDLAKYEQSFNANTNGKQEMDIFSGNESRPIEINENNSHFVVNTLWALGLVNKSKVLDEGPMREQDVPIENFASTGGWTLGSKTAKALYSSQEIIPLSDDQQEQVRRIAENVYRPCCGNSVAFPDCNHGMAALGYIELAVSSGLSEEQIYKDLLAFNSYWFPTTYVEMAVYFSQQGTEWEKVDPKLALSNEYSSAQGAQKVHQAVANVPGIKSQGGSCGA
ncbi:MAG: hypothetical protein A2900_02055 [Candidatus Chisholmbacteria bacterium RIFCSPLOWO2_01_FULL_50_28]|uniref:Uncharacterized protein n=1 Tax=Candidatus Chisholmbacteria bacterium RIFCSPHIGHO2_01_FULL_52_32 TaxID=1797591 RepID=A0A1G1VTL1_9BACT|nr:MAG: hypothetical protein A2786_04690 [Candidatus Chisholmbacteria bacterium RIFCSPHIGHO2_01_FULL_52_32]OGY19867.1 MAG: hypothetical protein A2900_02055 [Candidatus Chisholmbacteria bacterium RIFCSPLOWO2_01_FULL_50_28]